MPSKEAKSTPGRWEFITTSATHRCPDAAQRTLMRRHVMRDIGYSRRECQHASASSTDSPLFEPSHCLTQSVDISLPWQLPPKIIPPVTINDESYCVLHQMFADGSPVHLRIYRDMWYPVCSHDPAAFHQMLACYANHLFHLRGRNDRKMQRVMISNHMQALALVRERIGLMDQTVTEGFLLAILMMACYSHINADLETWSMHMSAIRNITSLRKIACQHNLGFSHFHRRLEAIGSYAFGVHPSLDTLVPTPMPAVDVAVLGKPLAEGIGAVALCCQPALINAFEALQDLVIHLTNLPPSKISSIWDDPFKLDSLVDPVTQAFLFLNSPTDIPSRDAAIVSCLCAGALLFMAELRRRSGISPVITAYQIDKLRTSLNMMDDYAALNPVAQLWLLTVGALESTGSADCRNFCLQIQCLKLELGIETFAQYHGLLYQVMWLPDLFDKCLSSLIL